MPASSWRCAISMPEMSYHARIGMPPLIVIGRTGAFGNTKRNGGQARSTSSGTIGSKSWPSAPRPCSQITAWRGFGAVSISMLGRAMALIPLEDGCRDGAASGASPPAPCRAHQGDFRPLARRPRFAMLRTFVSSKGRRMPRVVCIALVAAFVFTSAAAQPAPDDRPRTDRRSNRSWPIRTGSVRRCRTRTGQRTVAAVYYSLKRSGSPIRRSASHRSRRRQGQRRRWRSDGRSRWHRTASSIRPARMPPSCAMAIFSCAIWPADA